ncbi:LysR family transcriptional regulator [Parahaliea mediterranea]|uniref:LysR family transcriptional regulator n=1 Tax=Parahaliea mediterranea TaxID=651086 RepID=UPI000E2F3A3B|nr:LysR family transcriptional regulator [Parahaliea mediterranea]
MRLDQIDLNLFLVFEVIYREENLTRAAEVLKITQPSVSNALARLRRALNDPLFERNHAGMTPTPFARSIIGPVREALWRLNNSVIQQETFDPSTSSQTLRLSMDRYATAILLPNLAQALQLSAPGIVTECLEFPHHRIPDELTRGSVDVVITTPAFNEPLLCHRPLLCDEFVCVVREGHPELSGGLSLNSYLSLEHVAVAHTAPGLGHVDYALSAMGYKRRERLTVTDYLAIPRLLRTTNLAATLPRKLAAILGLPTIELPFQTPALELHLYWHISRDTDPCNRWLRQLIQQLEPGN